MFYGTGANHLVRPWRLARSGTGARLLATHTPGYLSGTSCAWLGAAGGTRPARRGWKDATGWAWPSRCAYLGAAGSSQLESEVYKEVQCCLQSKHKSYRQRIIADKKSDALQIFTEKELLRLRTTSPDCG